MQKNLETILENAPEGLNEQPTSWLFKIEPAQVAELEDLLDEEQYLKEIEN